MQTLSGLIEQSLNRIKEATIGVLDITDDKLRGHLRQLINNELGNENCFLADPVVEQTFGWESADCTFADLAEQNLFSAKLTDVLAKADNYDFPKTARPYIHQLQAWRHLLTDTPQSAIITSGTGSGKTECFMIPILEDLIRRQTQENTALVGVQALFLYPLNALINSQKERLDAWTKPFGNKIRFCLYNGNTKESAEPRDKDQPNQVLSRELLRKEPPPILLTNATMLEYMLVRQADAPILEKSRQAGSLRWIVLDEAHSYIGSQAAEIALLLRRVVHAFGKQPEDIRFVATSATIASDKAADELRHYLADLAGVPREQVLVVSGNRDFLPIGVADGRQSLTDIVSITNETERFTALCRSATATTLRNCLTVSTQPYTLNQLVQATQAYLLSGSLYERQREVLAWLDVMTQTKPSENAEPFLKLRLHLFQAMLHGLWACADRHCSVKEGYLEDWVFGQVYLNRRAKCDCGAPVYELVLCQDCGTPHLMAQESNGILHQHDTRITDEFALNPEPVDNDEENSGTDGVDGSNPISDGLQFTSHNKVLAAAADTLSENYTAQKIDKTTAEIGVRQGETFELALDFSLHACCSACGKESRKTPFYHQKYLGAPFYVTHAVPTVLEFCSDAENNPQSLPARGRRLITFTDSRQGTARMAVKMQQEAEYSKLRGMVFDVLVQETEKAVNNVVMPEIVAKIEQLKQTDPALAEMVLEAVKSKAQKSGKKAYLTWDDMYRVLRDKVEMAKDLLPYNRETNPVMFDDPSGNGSEKLAELLLSREFIRRPRNANSLETLGLAMVYYPDLDKISTLPDDWAETRVLNQANNPSKPLNLDDWKAFLKMLLDFHVRENSFTNLDEQKKRWLGKRFSGKSLLPPDTREKQTSRKQGWPQIRDKDPQPRAVKILQAVTGLDIRNPLAKNKINSWLKTAWKQLTIDSNILRPDADAWKMPLSAMAFRLPEKEMWLCPQSHRLIDTTLRGVSPYLPRNWQEMPSEKLFCSKIELPDYYRFKQDATAETRRNQMRRLLAQDEDVSRLRQKGLWSNLSDKIIEGGFYYRTAEHSAQLASAQLVAYEKMFKDGKINVLSCSTTMEMGVDIGGMAAVVMNNVPPHPANYLQRAGRAGRRSEAAAVAYTLCKNDPHNRRVFANPKWAFTTAIAAPKVSLSSAKIVSRHAHSLLLAEFLATRSDTGKDSTKLNTSWFFHPTKQVWQQFCDWMNSSQCTADQAIAKLTTGTALAGVPLAHIKERAVQRLTEMAENWQADFRSINYKINQTDNDLYKKALNREKKLHENENLLGHLAVNAFLPGYGFPTDVVEMKIRKMEDLRRERQNREDNLFVRKENPSRSLDIALREYAPGSEIVLDGRVYRSAGINLRVKSDEQGKNEAQRFDTAWRCKNCGASGVARYKYSHDDIRCYCCGEAVPFTEQQTVLTPAGFLTDFFEDSGNDVSSQTFVPTHAPRVQLNGTITALPQPDCGEIRYGSGGEVLFRSGGKHENGFAVCMRCGRADSMTEDNELPTVFSGDYHKTLGGGLDMGSKSKDCPNSNVQRNIHLSHRIQTDVLEIALKNPQTKAWLDSGNKTAARTIAVAVRDEIAACLGIETTEMGYAVREDKDLETGTVRCLIQIYDQAAGGAGFVLSAVDDINGILSRALDRLSCPADCGSVCQHCLAGGDSNVEREELDRHQALQWIEEAKFNQHLKLPASISRIAGSRYCARTPIAELEKRILEMQGGRLLIFVHQTGNNWDSPEIKAQVMKWQMLYQIQPVFCFTQAAWIDDNNIRELFHPFIQAGWQVAIASADVEDTILSAQLSDGIHTTSLLHIQPEEIFSRHTKALFTSECLSEVNTTLIDTENWFSQKGGKLINLNHELDGKLDSFGARMLALIDKQYPLSVQIKKDPITAVVYTDRYLKSPLTLLILDSVIKELYCLNKKPFSTLELNISPTRQTYQNSEYLWHDWQNSNMQQEVFKQWFSNYSNKISVNIIKSQLQHARILKLMHESGEFTNIIYDQGMGYWGRITLPHAEASLRFYPFDQDALFQISHLNKCKQINTNIATDYDWDTYIVFNIC